MNWKKKLAACAAITSFASLAIYIINKASCFIATADNLLCNNKGSFYEWRFGNIFYTKKGNGKPVLLIHDLSSCSSSYEWAQIEDELSKTNTVYSIDLLGCGRSDKPDVTYTNFLYVELITDFIKHVISEKADVIASGESGSFVIMACKNDPTVIDKVMMINPLSLTELAQVPTKNSRTVKLLISIPLIGTLLYNLLNNKRNIEKTFASEYFYRPSLVKEEYISTYTEAAHLDNSRSKYLFASIKGKYTKANIIPCLRDITNSIFIVYGDEEPEYAQIAEQYKQAAPSIESTAIENAKYLPQMEVPEKLLEQIQILFAEEPAGAADDNE